MKRGSIGRAWRLALVAVLLLAPAAGAQQAQEVSVTRTVFRVQDGDTLVLDKNEIVRLIGLDALEVLESNTDPQDLSQQARAAVEDLVRGQRFRIEGDPMAARKDRYGRTLVYLFFEDGRCLNTEIVRSGWGIVMTRYPFTRVEEFRAAQEEAQKADRGLWALTK